MPGPWTWNAKARRYRDLSSGRFLSAAAERALRDDFVARTHGAVDALASRVSSGEMPVSAWERGMRSHTRIVHTAQYMFGRGGRKAMTEIDNAALSDVVREQWTYLGGFADAVSAGGLSEAQIRARSGLYVNAARGSYERGRAAAFAGLKLPAHPGDGSTRCKCITSPSSRVLTRRGLVAIADVVVGDEAWTHMGRWRPVVAVHRHHPSPDHRQATITAPSGHSVGCTSDHRWLTPNGWRSADYIGNGPAMLYHYEHERLVRLWGAERHASPAMSFLLEPRYRAGTVGQPRTAQDDPCSGGDGTRCAAHPFLGPDMGLVQDGEDWRWPGIRLVLGRRGPPSNDLPLSMDLGQGAWPDTGRHGRTPQERDTDRRRAGQPRSHDCRQSQSATPDRRQAASHAGRSWPRSCGQDRQVLRRMWGDHDRAPSLGSPATVLLGGVLPRGTTLYDLTVAEDHSFVIEGMTSHNSNCQCGWEIEEGEGVYLCTWQTHSGESCEDCVGRSFEWAPLVLQKGAA